MHAVRRPRRVAPARRPVHVAPHGLARRRPARRVGRARPATRPEADVAGSPREWGSRSPRAASRSSRGSTSSSVRARRIRRNPGRRSSSSRSVSATFRRCGYPASALRGQGYRRADSAGQRGGDGGPTAALLVESVGSDRRPKVPSPCTSTVLTFPSAPSAKVVMSLPTVTLLAVAMNVS